jgi:hypothetical protein
MLGVVFTEFTDMVEQAFGPETLDDMITGVVSRLESGGAYTAVGTYHHDEMVLLVSQLAKQTGRDIDELVELFGQHLFGRFVVRYPGFFEGVDNALDFLETVEGHIHFEVRKLYPTAELPTFVCERKALDHLVMEYHSTRPFAMLCRGLIKGCGDHYGERFEIEEAPLADGASGMCFAIRRR